MGNLDINIGKLKKNAFRYSKVRGETASRIRIPGGVIDAASLGKVVEIAEKYGNGVIDITSVMLETHINIDGRTDLQRGTRYIASLDAEKFGQINPVYSQNNNFVTQRDLDEDFNLDNDLEIDWATETKDKGNHLNYWGAKKVSDFLGKYMESLGILENHKNDPYYKSWHTAYSIYKEKLQ